ncbi:FAD binding domain-containing protein [Acidisphaera rubrifaciens]|uniref:Carbon monoxide dehydrogenase n=1 Tax=Acidisphaera rubrifaciens HS-AP3 TaxID=1231350 RepID=A0A0D6P9R2_9PROT|nr:FAD binding domain-containing protein [Acidisphaera rubrifaciens]GAN78500.1 carbon monoxide dehydrogenase [Acidisphaera rubrifaciens HS-AP3]
MKPAPFAYLRAATTEEALEALAAHGTEARILAGGQSLVAMLNMRLARPSLLIDIMRVPALGRVEVEGDDLCIGAAVRQAALERRPDLAREVPLLARALPWVGHYQTRARGTVCGSAAHADPSAEIPLCLVALGARVGLRRRSGRRTVGAEAFFAGTMQTECAPDEMIDRLIVPRRRPDTGYAFAEIGRRHGDFAIVACAAVAGPHGLRLAVGGVADRPVARDFPPLDGSALDDALNAFAWALGGRDDMHATARYRRGLVRRMGRQVLEEAMACRN